MVDNIKYYFRIYKNLVINDIKSQVSYKVDFIAQIIIWSLYTLLPFFTLSLLFARVESVGEWNVYSISIVYGVVGIAYDGARMIGRGFDSFEKLLVNGELDVFFIRPLSITFQVFSSKFFLRRIAGIVQYLAILVFGLVNFESNDLSSIIIVGLFCIINMFLVFLGLLIIYSSICFFTIKKNLFSEVVVDNVASLGYYPLEYFNKPLELIFMFIIPIFFSVYLPMKTVLFTGTGVVKYVALGVLLSVVFFKIAHILFSFSIKQYQSTNN